MARNLIAEKRIAARRLVVFRGEDDAVAQVYALRRPRSEDLQAHGFAEILGPEALAMAQGAAQRQREHEALLAQASTDEDRARIQGEIDGMLAQRNHDVTVAVLTDADRKQRLLMRCEAWLMASFEAIGIARDEAPIGLQPRGAAPDAVCLDVGAGFLQRGRFVPGPDAAADEIPLSEIPVDERIALGLLAMQAFEVASALATFPRPAGAARHG